MVYHPHGIYSWGFIASGSWRPHYYKIGLTGLIANALVHAPFFRLLCTKIMGGIEGADKGTMLRKMKKGESFGLIPGGFEEASTSCPGKDRVFLKKRKVRLGVDFQIESFCNIAQKNSHTVYVGLRQVCSSARL